MKILKYTLICLLLIGSYHSKAQESETGPRFSGCWRAIDSRINDYANALNYLRADDQLPEYLSDYLLDWRNGDRLSPCVKDRDEKLSFRRSILDRVTNEISLKRIIKSDNENYDKLYDPGKQKKEMKKSSNFYSYPELPFMDKSWRQLAKRRLEIIQELKDKAGIK